MSKTSQGPKRGAFSEKQRGVVETGPELLPESARLNSLLLDTLPSPTMLIGRDRIVLAANRMAKEAGVKVGDYCWKTFGRGEYIPEEDKRYMEEHGVDQSPGGTKCTFCLADEALDEQEAKNSPEVRAFGRIWDTWWVPVGGDVYLHYAVDVTDRKEMEDALRRAQEELELRVETRTAELARSQALLDQQIAEHERTGQILRKSEERFRTVADFAYDWEYWVGPNGEFLYVSPSCQRITGYSPDEFQSDPGLLGAIVHPEDSELIARHLGEELVSREAASLDFRILTRGNEQRWIAHVCQPVYSDEGRHLGRRASNWDVTERKMAEDRIRLNESRLEALVRLNQMTGASLEELADFVLEEGIKLTKSEMGFLGFMDDSERNLIIHAWSRDALAQCSVVERHIHFPVEVSGLWGDVIRHRNPVIINDYSMPHPQKRGYPEGHVPIYRFICVPAFEGPKIVAVVGMANKELDYDESDIRQLKLFLEGIWRIMQRKQAEETLLESERRYRTLFESAPAGIVLSTYEGRVLAANDATLRMVGFLREDLERINTETLFFDPADRVRLLEILRTRGLVQGLEMKLKRKDGTPFYANLTLTSFGLGGKDVILTVIDDISEQRRAKEALLRSQEQLRLLSSQLFQAQEEERKRIALELHDGPAQTLSAIKVWVEAARLGMGQEDITHVARALESVVALARGAVEEIRRICRNLWPSVLDDLGILATISWLCREFETTYSGIRIEKKIDIEEKDVPDSLKIVVFRILQEALNNAVKHSEADHVTLSVKKRDGDIELKINDNGVGFDVGNVVSEKQLRRGLGLVGMRERTELSGGSFAIESTPGEGSTIRASWPCYAE